MASIKPHKSGGWRARINLKGVNTSKVCRTKAQAERWAREVETAIDNGTFHSVKPVEQITLGEALDRYAEEVSVKKKSYRQEISKIKKIKTDRLARMQLNAITTADIIAYRTRLERAGYAPATIQKRLAIISHLYTVANVHWGFEHLVSPVRRGVLPRIQNARDRRLKEGEEELLLAVAADYGDGRMAYIIRLALETAMRAGEITRILWKDVDIENRIIRLHDTKNGSPRDVPLSRRAIRALEEWREKAPTIGPDDLVFDYADTHQITTAFIRITRAAGIENLRFHDLRHEATSRLVERGLESIQVSAVTGHKSLIMLRRYYHPRASQIARLLDDEE